MIWFPAAVTVVTATQDVQACLPLAGGEVAAGTQGGLVLVGEDGGMKQVWTALDGLPGTRIGALADDGHGGMWVGGEAGLARVKLSGAELAIAELHETKPVRAIIVRDGKTFAATWGGGVVEVGSGDPKVVAAAGAQVTSIAIVDGILFAGTTAGVVRGDGHATTGLPSTMVWSLASAPDGKLWAGTLAGLAVIDRETGAAQVEGHADTRALLAGDSLIVGTYGEGVLGEVDLAAIHVNGMARAHGETCVAAREGLVVRRDGGAWQKARLVGLPDNDVSALALSGHDVWLGTFDHGLAVRRAGSEDWQPIAGIDSRINALLADNGAIWVGTARGLVEISATGDVKGRWGVAEGMLSAEVHTLTRIKTGVAAGTARGVVLIEGAGAAEKLTLIGERQGLPSTAIWAVAEEKPGVLWIGTSRGVVRWEKGHARRFSMASGHLDEDWVTAITVENGGNDVWIGTYSKGVTHLHRDGKKWPATHFGGGAVNVSGLAREGQSIYAATMNGLIRRDVAASAGTPWSAIAHAAPGNDVTAVAFPSSEPVMWVGSRRGITSLSR